MIRSRKRKKMKKKKVYDDYQISADAELPPVALFDAYVSDRRAGEGSPSQFTSATALRSAPSSLLLYRVFFSPAFSLRSTVHFSPTQAMYSFQNVLKSTFVFDKLYPIMD
jgi:hypothetical protein